MKQHKSFDQLKLRCGSNITKSQSQILNQANVFQTIQKNVSVRSNNCNYYDFETVPDYRIHYVSLR